nr:hypothetical protein CFP56_21797 [Quercus suber]
MNRTDHPCTASGTQRSHRLTSTACHCCRLSLRPRRPPFVPSAPLWTGRDQLSERVAAKRGQVATDYESGQKRLGRFSSPLPPFDACESELGVELPESISYLQEVEGCAFPRIWGINVTIDPSQRCRRRFDWGPGPDEERSTGLVLPILSAIG